MEDSRVTRKKISVSWQRSLLPFMSRTIILLSLFFFIASLLQLLYLHKTIANNPQIDLKQIFVSLDSNNNVTNENLLKNTKLKALVLLEKGAMEQQYFQANMLLMGRLWTSYIGFVTGMIMAIVGCAFILGKLRERESAVRAKTGGSEISLRTTSPGLLLAVLGTCLMITTLVSHHQITASHVALYLHDAPESTPSDTLPPPSLRSPASMYDSNKNNH